MPGPASTLLAQNVVNLVTLMTVDGQFAPDFDDEIVAGSCVTADSQIRHAPTAELLARQEGARP
jgi:NAD(P) transhydrogenase subunit alpha